MKTWQACALLVAVLAGCAAVRCAGGLGITDAKAFVLGAAVVVFVALLVQE